jgi:hypothetical protein
LEEGWEGEGKMLREKRRSRRRREGGSEVLWSSG